MARARKKKRRREPVWVPSERYLSIQLTPEQSAELRNRTQEKIDKAAADGVYERFAQLRGKVKFSMTYEELKGRK